MYLFIFIFIHIYIYIYVYVCFGLTSRVQGSCPSPKSASHRLLAYWPTQKYGGFFRCWAPSHDRLNRSAEVFRLNQHAACRLNPSISMFLQGSADQIEGLSLAQGESHGIDASVSPPSGAPSEAG